MHDFKYSVNNISLHKILIILVSLICSNLSFAYHLKSGDKLIIDFEDQPFDGFGGAIGSYGSNFGSGITNECAYNGSRSFKLVFSKEITPAESEHFIDYKPSGRRMNNMGTITSPIAIKNIDWAVFILNMGPIIDTSIEPVKIQSVDLSQYSYLIFWVKGKRGGEDFRIYLRDINAGTYDPQVKLKPRVAVQARWKRVILKLKRIKSKVDLTNIVQIGIGYGKEDGNKRGNIIYVDNFILVK